MYQENIDLKDVKRKQNQRYILIIIDVENTK